MDDTMIEKIARIVFISDYMRFFKFSGGGCKFEDVKDEYIDLVKKIVEHIDNYEGQK